MYVSIPHFAPSFTANAGAYKKKIPAKVFAGDYGVPIAKGVVINEPLVVVHPNQIASISLPNVGNKKTVFSPGTLEIS